MSLVNLIKGKTAPVGFATATLATLATLDGGNGRTVATVATVAVAKSESEKPVTIDDEPFDPEAWEERAAICELDAGLTRDQAEGIAWLEDDRRRCCHCLNLRGSTCSVAKPGGEVSAIRGYRPVDLPRRCVGYRPCPDDPDRRPGSERWGVGTIGEQP